jgi:hypothetical protein
MPAFAFAVERKDGYARNGVFERSSARFCITQRAYDIHDSDPQLNMLKCFVSELACASLTIWNGAASRNQLDRNIDFCHMLQFAPSATHSRKN